MVVPDDPPFGAAMAIIPEIAESLGELTQIRRDIHAHPEIGFEEERTAEIVAAKLKDYGCEVHRGLATTGVVGTIRRGNSLRAIGLRADMDCLPMQELNEFSHRSTHDGKMHACGHDGHTTMLLGAAKYLAKTRNFDGTVHFIFQPGEEGFGGGRVMVEQGLFDKFPCDAVFAMHNKPGIPIGNMATTLGPLLAASATATTSRSRVPALMPRTRMAATTRSSSAHRSLPPCRPSPRAMSTQSTLL
jgi:amidohydrolase